MSTKTAIAFIAGVVVFLVLYVGHRVIKRNLSNQLSRKLSDKDYQGYSKLLDSWRAKYFFKPYNIAYLRLTAAMVKNDTHEIDKCFEAFESTRMKSKEKEDIIYKAFNYYLALEDYRKAKRYYEFSQNMFNKGLKNEIEIMYNTYCEKGYKFLDELLKSTEEMPLSYRTANYSIISQMYENKGDKKNAEEFLNKAREAAKEVYTELEKQKEEEQQEE